MLEIACTNAIAYYAKIKRCSIKRLDPLTALN